ncbi:hypothetical protein RB195_024245 [Necator americanus]|uniref:Reverse transcriptase domain-containing protein n=1 Tax=Necator americanus TaxID=51031 RepID=A0ABR1EMI3_NECAM
MRKLEKGHMGVEADGRQLHHLRFADDIVLITPSISQAEPMLTEFEETCGYIGLRLNLQKTMFMRNGWVSDALFTLNGTNIPKYHKEGHDRSHGVDLCVDATMELAEAAEEDKRIGYAHRNFAYRKTKMTVLQNPDGTTTKRRWARSFTTSTQISLTATSTCLLPICEKTDILF